MSLRAFSLLSRFLSCALAASLLACAANLKSPLPQPQADQAPEDELPNMDELEADNGVHLFSTPESRALNVSSLWAKHAERLRASSPKASLAAYLRAAHTALAALDADACNDAFNESCAELRRSYELALAQVVRSYRERSWEQIDLAPTRYRLTLASERGVLDLANWGTIQESTSASGVGHRPGVGSEAVGCRTLASPGLPASGFTTCAPLTFVLSFDSSPSSERTAASLIAYDASQRSVIDLSKRQVTLAADFGLSLKLVSDQAESAGKARLFCVGTPGASRQALVTVAPSGLAPQVIPVWLPLLTDPSTSERLDFCFFSIDPAASRDGNSRALASAARLLAQSPAANALNPKASGIFFIAAGPEGSFVTASFLGRLKRATRGRARHAGKADLRVRGIYLMAPEAPFEPLPEATARLSARSAALQVPVYQAPTGAERISLAQQAAEIRAKVTEALEDAAQQSSEDGTPQFGATFEMSPIY